MTHHPSPYAGKSIVFATMHGKEKLAAPAFAKQLNAAVIAPHHLDTDQFGTFAGDIPRTLTPLAAATVKARLGIQISGLPYGLASEGSFTSNLIGIENTEIVVFLDTDRRIELVEHASGSSPLPAAREVETVADALAYASSIGFPEQGLLVRAHHGPTVEIYKSIDTASELARIVSHCLKKESTLTVLPDHRAHRSPTRGERIRVLCNRMAHRLATPCPSCHAPGYGTVNVERGLPCALCGEPTTGIAADIHGCRVCDFEARHVRGDSRADPATCMLCNP